MKAWPVVLIAFEAILAALTPFSKTVYGIPWTVFMMVAILGVAFLGRELHRRSEPYLMLLPTKDSLLMRKGGHWYGVVYWGRPRGTWAWARLKGREYLAFATEIAIIFPSAYILSGIFFGFDATFLSIMAVLAGMIMLAEAHTIVGMDFVAVRLD